MDSICKDSPSSSTDFQTNEHLFPSTSQGSSANKSRSHRRSKSLGGFLSPIKASPDHQTASRKPSVTSNRRRKNSSSAASRTPSTGGTDSHPSGTGSHKKRHLFPFTFNQKLPFPVEISYRPVRARTQYVPDAQYSMVKLESGMSIKYYGATLTPGKSIEDANKDVDIRNVLMIPPHVDSSLGARHHGLSSQEATTLLVAKARETLSQQTLERVSVKDFFSLCEVWLVVLCIILLIFSVVYHIVTIPELNWHQLVDSIIEIASLFLLLVGSVFLYLRENWLNASELVERIHEVINTIETSGLNVVQKINIPPATSVSLSRVVRDGIVRIVPSILLVEGDVVELLYGENAPCKMRYVYVSHSSASMSDEDSTTTSGLESPQAAGLLAGVRKEFILEANSVLQPSLFGIPPDRNLKNESLMSHGRFQFLILETPLLKNIAQACSISRPATLFQNQCIVWRKCIIYRIMPAIVVLCFIVNVCYFAINTSTGYYSSSLAVGQYPLFDWVQRLIIAQIHCLIASLPLMFPVIWLVIRSYGNAHILTLFEALQNSKTDFEDNANVDEFDEEAPPPIKELSLDRGSIFSKFFRFWGHDNDIARTQNLLEALGSTTVLCSVDKEGPLTSYYATPDQLMFPNSDMDLTIFDLDANPNYINGIRFEDRDWENYINFLKPLGLCLLLNTNCDSRKLNDFSQKDPHPQRTALSYYSNLNAARESCWCMLGREIGFSNAICRSYVCRKEIYTVAPYHSSLQQFHCDCHVEVPSVVSRIFEEEGKNSYQVISDGCVEIILDSSADFWDGTSLRPMCAEIEKKIYDFYQSAVVNDMQCVAYSYCPISTERRDRIPFLHSQDNSPGFIYMELPYEPPAILETIQSNYSIEVGRLMDEINNEQAATTSCPTIPSEASLSHVAPDVTFSIRRRPTRYSKEDHKDFIVEAPFNKEKEVELYRNLIKGQIFLGLVTFHQIPKMDVCDFIEDLRSAGIRFVYFSDAHERPSKAFAERLGLETDWNSCIILSSPVTGSYHSGYVESHDIKAKLPRGIENIRSHLIHVDDIPLQVSLFADCIPSSTTEMIRIFQENGEVVCCVGNAMNKENTAAFAQSDISVAVEIPKGLGDRSPRQHASPIALGEALNGLPCTLFMPFETSMYALAQIIREARTLTQSFQQAFAFLYGCSVSIALLYILCYCFGLPPVFYSYQMLFIIWFLIPILSISFLGSPHEAETMNRMPVKNINHVAGLRRYVGYYFLRFLPMIIMCVVIFAMCLISFAETPIDTPFDLIQFYSTPLVVRQDSVHWRILYSQLCTMFAFVYFSVWMSSTFLARTLSIVDYVPFKNVAWMFMSAFVLLFQVLFMVIIIVIVGQPFFSILSWKVYILVFGFPLAILPIQEAVKLLDKQEYTRFQKRSKLEFNTKLGMHSPL